MRHPDFVLDQIGICKGDYRLVHMTDAWCCLALLCQLLFAGERKEQRSEYQIDAASFYLDKRIAPSLPSESHHHHESTVVFSSKEKLVPAGGAVTGTYIDRYVSEPELRSLFCHSFGSPLPFFLPPFPLN